MAPPRCAILPPVPVPYREPLFELLAERGRIAPRVLFWSGQQGSWDQRAEWFPTDHRYDARVLRSWQRARPGRTPVLVPRGIGRELAAFDPDCVVVWEYGPATLRALPWCRRRGVPLVIYTELPDAADAGLSGWQLAIHRRLVPRADAFLAASESGRERLVRLGADPAAVSVSLQSADTGAYDAVRATPPSERPVQVLATGRLVPDKNLARLIEAFAAAGLGAEEAELVICGGGPLEQELRGLAGRLGAPVRFRGQVAPAELPGVYAQAAVVALVSTFEPFGVTMREGAAAGRALLCSRTAGAAGSVAIEGRNALLIDPADGPGIAAALAALVREPDLRRRLAAESARVSDERPLERDAEAFEDAVLAQVPDSSTGRTRSRSVSTSASGR